MDPSQKNSSPRGSDLGRSLAFYDRLILATQKPTAPKPPRPSDPLDGLPRLANYGAALILLLLVLLSARLFSVGRISDRISVVTAIAGRQLSVAAKNVYDQAADSRAVAAAGQAIRWEARGLAAAALDLSAKTRQQISLQARAARAFWSGAIAGCRLAAQVPIDTISASVRPFRSGFALAGDSARATIMNSHSQVAAASASFGRMFRTTLSGGSQLAAAGPLNEFDIQTRLGFGDSLSFLVSSVIWPEAGTIVAFSYLERSGGVRRFVADTWSLGQAIGNAWNGFLGRMSGETLSETAREQIKSEIMAELEQKFDSSGLVVMKPTASSSADAANIRKLQDAFSDRVIVDFAEDGQTGVIQPVFRDKVGQKYMFVLTPSAK
jgi:hypothetical protein